MQHLGLATLLAVTLLAPVAAKPSPQWFAKIRADVERVEAALAKTEDRAARAEAIYGVKPAPQARARIFQLLEEYGVAAETLAIEAMVHDWDPRVRQAAAGLLGATGGEGAREALEKVSLTDEDSSYRTGCEAVTANAREAAAAALQALEARLGPPPTQTSWLNSTAEEPTR
jgi:acyl-homoserine lactone acylase PvdQ